MIRTPLTDGMLKGTTMISINMQGREHRSVIRLPSEQSTRQVLTFPESDIELYIPELPVGYHIISGSIHKDARHLTNVVPDSECVISPIVEFTWYFNGQQAALEKGFFVIKLPHYMHLKQGADELPRMEIVRRVHSLVADIPYFHVPYKKHLNANLSRVDSYYDIDSDHIWIYTSNFCPFVCSVCRNSCNENLLGLAHIARTGSDEIVIETFVTTADLGSKHVQQYKQV